MIAELVLFKTPKGMDRDAVLADARLTVSRWQVQADLLRKHYLLGEDGTGGGLYLWPSREAAERAHDADWRSSIERCTGAPPTIRSFDVLVILDNEAGTATEY